MLIPLWRVEPSDFQKEHGILSFRRVVNLPDWEYGDRYLNLIEVTYQRLRGTGPGWKQCDAGYGCAVGLAWRWGQEHRYWDGPHCFYYFGCFKFWSFDGNCKKCYGER